MANATFSSFYCGLKSLLFNGKIKMQRKSSFFENSRKEYSKQKTKKGQFYDKKNQTFQHCVAFAYWNNDDTNQRICNAKN